METCRPLIIDLAVGYGGSSSRVLGILRALADQGAALAGLDQGAVVLAAQKEGLPVYTVGAKKTDPRIVSRLVHLIREKDFQVLDTQNIQSKFWGSLAAGITNTSLVSTINSWYASEHGQSSGKDRLKGRMYTALELFTNRNLDLYITVSEKDRQALMKSGIPSQSIELIYNAVSFDDSQISSDPDGLRKKFNLPPQSLICTAVGRLVPVKGYDLLIEAVRQVAAQIPQLYCLIVGEGECMEELSNQIKDAGLQDRVLLTGYQDRNNVMPILKSSDIFAMPSRYEGTPIALLEAAAMGLPIIAAAAGGIPELVTNQEHALLVEPNNPAALAEGLRKLCSDLKFAQKLGDNAQQRVRTVFNMDTQIQNTFHAYQKALDRHDAKRKKITSK